MYGDSRKTFATVLSHEAGATTQHIILSLYYSHKVVEENGFIYPICLKEFGRG